ncbi:putative Disabled 2-like isoform X3 protein, partial [Naja naja]
PTKCEKKTSIMECSSEMLTVHLISLHHKWIQGTNWTLSLLSSVCIICLILQLLDSFKRPWNFLSQGSNLLESKLEPLVIFSPCGWKKTLYGVSYSLTFWFHQCLEALKVKNER